MVSREVVRAALAAGSMMLACGVASGRELEQVEVSRTWEARPGPVLTAHDLLGVTDLGGVAASPTGDEVAFVSRRADTECDCYHQRLQLANRRTGVVAVLDDLGQPFAAAMPDGTINGALMTAQPLWAADGQRLAFLANVSGRAVLRTYDASRHKIEDVDTRGEEVFAFMWSEAHVLVYETGGVNPSVVADAERSARAGYLYGEQFLGVAPGRLPVTPRVPITLAWNADMFASPRATLSQLKSIRLDTGELRPATAVEQATFKLARPSSAYQSIFFRRSSTRHAAAGRYRLSLDEPTIDGATRVSLVDTRSATQKPRDIGRLCDGTVADAFGDAAAPLFVIVCASQTETWKDFAQFIKIDPLTMRPKRWFELASPGIFDGLLGLPCDLARGEMVCVEEQASSPPRLVLMKSTGERRVLTDPNEGLRIKHYGKVERLAWSNQFGVKTWAYLVYPSGYTAGQKYPLVVVQYNASGFLRGGTGNEYPMFPLAEAGFFVLNFQHPEPAPEAENLTDRERASANWHNNKWRKSIQDSLDTVIEQLTRRGLIDPNRVAYTGLSGGANQIDYALANKRRIAAVISSTCCIGPENWASTAANLMYGPFREVTGWPNPATEQNYEESWSAVSPSLHVPEIHAPILVHAAESEMLAPNALWLKMRHHHKPMEVYILPNEHHIKNRPIHRQAIYQRNIDWLRFWLQDYEGASPSNADQYPRWRALRDEWKQHDPCAQRVASDTCNEQFTRTARH
jgi:dipeptidyl aminopeptidase/acylaminoacyl peptidase